MVDWVLKLNEKKVNMKILRGEENKILPLAETVHYATAGA
jgi:hypothetical protein